MLRKWYENSEAKKRVVELILATFSAGILVALSRLETQLFTLRESFSENKEFFSSLVYFSLINVNVILALFLGFLIFRNVTKLIIERKRGVFGSKLRTKLVMAFVFFALAPTLLLFYVSTKFITRSFETWFSDKVNESMQQTRQAGSSVYEHDQKRLESLARIALKRIQVTLPVEEDGLPVFDSSDLKGFESEYGLQGIILYHAEGQQVWSSSRGKGSLIPEKMDGDVEKAIEVFVTHPDKFSLSMVVANNKQDVVKGFAPIRFQKDGRLLGVVMTEISFETRILESIEKILSDFSNLKPGAQLIRMSYTILMVVMTLLIVFSATWLGFYVARDISGPLQNLSEAARAVSLGNYTLTLSSKRDDETGQLVQAFNRMTKDLKAHQEKNERVQQSLQKTNEELEQRRQYMEIVLKNISAGVLAIDADGYVTSVNSAAEKLLQLQAQPLRGEKITKIFTPTLAKTFWHPIEKALSEEAVYHGQLGIPQPKGEISLSVDATKIYDENHVEIGAVLVFADTTLQVMVQKAAAWREVARRIAHEIKNPITPIKLSAQRLHRRFSDRFQGEDLEVFTMCTDTIVGQVDTLRNLVNEFSNFSRLPTIRPEWQKVSDVLLDVVKLFEMSYPEVDFEKKKMEDVPPGFLDREQVSRAFVNLFTNAISAIVPGRKGKITVSCEYLSQTKTVRIEILDNGCGIPAKLRERVLEPYFSTKEKGSGLGLAIVNQIVIDHQGYLRIGENHPFGTRISLEFPASVRHV